MVAYLFSQNSYRGMQFLSWQNVSQGPNCFYPKNHPERSVLHTQPHTSFHRYTTVPQTETRAPSGCVTLTRISRGKHVRGARSAHFQSHKKTKKSLGTKSLENCVTTKTKNPALNEELAHQPTTQRERVRTIIMTDNDNKKRK